MYTVLSYKVFTRYKIEKYHMSKNWSKFYHWILMETKYFSFPEKIIFFQSAKILNFCEPGQYLQSGVIFMTQKTLTKVPKINCSKRICMWNWAIKFSPDTKYKNRKISYQQKLIKILLLDLWWKQSTFLSLKK